MQTQYPSKQGVVILYTLSGSDLIEMILSQFSQPEAANYYIKLHSSSQTSSKLLISLHSLQALNPVKLLGTVLMSIDIIKIFLSNKQIEINHIQFLYLFLISKFYHEISIGHLFVTIQRIFTTYRNEVVIHTNSESISVQFWWNYRWLFITDNHSNRFHTIFYPSPFLFVSYQSS